jgi:hypothetical protein
MQLRIYPEPARVDFPWLTGYRQRVAKTDAELDEDILAELRQVAKVTRTVNELAASTGERAARIRERLQHLLDEEVISESGAVPKRYIFKGDLGEDFRVFPGEAHLSEIAPEPTDKA